MKTNSEKQQKRDYLKNISAPLLELKEMGSINTVNEGLKSIYSEQGFKNLKTFDQWKNEGYRVKQGETAVYLWGKQKSRTITENGEEREIKYFPMIAVFSESQVYNPENDK